MKTRFISGVVLLVCLILASGAWAQWSPDPSQNLAIANKPANDQVQPKLKALSGNGWYVGWFDADPTTPPPVGYDPTIQRLNSAGVEQLPHNGVRIADLGNSSTQDWGMDVDAQGEALMTFLDTRDGSNQQVTATKIGPLGGQLWGPRGVQLTNDSSFHAAPKIAGTSDGNVVVAWTSDSNVVLQKLDTNGVPQWGAGIVFSETGFNYSVADLHAGDNGSVILSFVRDQGFGSDRQLRANKISPSGGPLWGAHHIAVFDKGSLQFGNWPSFITDRDGGAVFSWYTSSPTLQVFAQHIFTEGIAAFRHNGVAVSTDTTNVRVSPSVSYDPRTGDTYVFWTEEDSNQFTNGVSGQKLGKTGARKWGSTGRTIVPLGADAQIFVENVHTSNGPLVFWVDEASFTSSQIVATKLDPAGRITCPQFPVSTAAVSPFGLVAATAPSGLAALVWSDNRLGNNGIYIQNVNRDCSLGQ